MVREAIFLILFSILSVVMGQTTTNATEHNSATSSLSGLWALFLTMAIVLVRHFR